MKVTMVIISMAGKVGRRKKSASNAISVPKVPGANGTYPIGPRVAIRARDIWVLFVISIEFRVKS